MYHIFFGVEKARERELRKFEYWDVVETYLLRYFAMEMEGSVGESKDFNRECDLLLDFDSEDGIVFFSLSLSI